MSEDDPDDDDRRPSGPPLPPDDRLWRHPSELAARSVDAPAGPDGIRRRAWPAAALGVVAGAALATSGIVLTGSLSPRVVERHVVEKVAVVPLVSTVLGDEQELDGLIERVGPAVVRVEVQRGGAVTAASGLVFRDDGLILTVAHHLVDAGSVVVVLADGRRLVGEAIGLDELTDVAVVDVDVDGLPVAVLELAEDLQVGEVVVALGAPPDRPTPPSIATGMITGVDRWARLEGGVKLHGLLETDAETDVHHDGGPLVDETGAAVGLTTVTADDGTPRGHAVPMHLAHRVALRLIETGDVDHAWLGVEAADIDQGTRDELGVDGGALVLSVVAGSPAERAGLAVGDVVTHADDRPVTSAAALVSVVRRCAPGDDVALRFWRDGAEHAVGAVVAERPDG
ncbi:MAG: S1C family serine protease [Acidimicrobiia bacterium]